MEFTVIDKEEENPKENKFSFALNFWPSFYNPSGNGGWNSGAYDFRPIDNLFENLPYSQLKNAYLYKGDHMSKMIFYFEK